MDHLRPKGGKNGGCIASGRVDPSTADVGGMRRDGIGVPGAARQRGGKKALKRAHCKLGRVSGNRKGHVKKQKPKPGKKLRAGSKVSIKLG